MSGGLTMGLLPRLRGALPGRPVPPSLLWWYAGIIARLSQDLATGEAAG
jgi:hypothetical protein